LACDEEKKHEIISAVRTTLALRSDVQLNIIDGVRATFPIGMGILRASNTQPVLSMRFEADTRHDLQELKEVFIKAMAPYLDESLLQKELMERRGGSDT
jgi:phosphomannomutase/phosphoglucomutase